MDKAAPEDKIVPGNLAQRRTAADMGGDDILFAARMDTISVASYMESSGIGKED